ncbi:MAG: LPS-assembly protein LptD, partial [Rikenellaceae bacterium]|nr:LPS-assembly protein LptD [Rikenellaceae bacterium]
MVFGVAVPNGALLTSAQQTVAVDSAEQSPAQLTPQTADSRAARRRAQLQTTESNAAEEDRPIGGDFRSRIDSSNLAPEYGGEAPYQIDSTPAQQSTAHKGSALEAPITGKNKDSLVFNVRDKMVYIYREGDVKYQSMNMKADFMAINMDNRQIRAYGIYDTVNNEPTVTRPQFTEGGKTFTMDTIDYNMESGKAKIKGIATQEGEGYLIGKNVKKMADNTIHIADGMFTTCDHTDHPHFGLVMSKAKLIP